MIEVIGFLIFMIISYFGSEKAKSFSTSIVWSLAFMASFVGFVESLIIQIIKAIL